MFSAFSRAASSELTEATNFAIPDRGLVGCFLSGFGLTLSTYHKPKTQQEKSPQMSNLYKKFETDKQAEKAGVLYEVHGSFRVRLARMSAENKKFKQKVNELMKPYRKIPLEDIPEKKLKEINLKVYCETIILPNTWQTWVPDEVSEDGKPSESGKWVDGIHARDGIVPATSENYQMVLNDLDDLYRLLVSEASSPDIYRKEALEAELKNS